MRKYIRSRKRRQNVTLLAIMLISLVVGALFTGGELFENNLQAVVYDSFLTSTPVQIKRHTVIVGIDDATIQSYGRWPLPRRAYAELLDKLTAAGAAVVGLDLILAEASDKPEDDLRMAEAIRKNGKVILAVQGAGSGERSGGRQKFTEQTLALPLFKEAANDVGAVNINPDPDGKVRDAQLVVDLPVGRFYSLPLVAVAHFLGGNSGSISATAQQLSLNVDSTLRPIPVDKGGGMAVYFAAAPAADLSVKRLPCADSAEFCVVSLRDTVAGKVPASLFKNSIVLVGAHSAAALPDSYAVSNAGSKMYGVEIWANTIQTLLTERYPVRRQSVLPTLLSLFVITGIGMLLIVRWRLWGFLGALLLFALYALVSLVWFGIQARGGDKGVIEVPSIAYIAPALLSWIIVIGYLLLEEQRSLARTQSTFGRFVTESVAKTIMLKEEEGTLAMGGEVRDVTVLFGDIRGFTTLSEGLAPEKLLDILNFYFEGIVRVVTQYQGTVNKYNGDNIMVIWGAPLPLAHPEQLAVEAALSVQRWLHEQMLTRQDNVSFGFGINSGPAVVGFMGALGRLEYTVIGDTVNVASRLTSADIARSGQVAISEAVYLKLDKDNEVLNMGSLTVKGRAQPVQCYQVNRLRQLSAPAPAPALAEPQALQERRGLRP